MSGYNLPGTGTFLVLMGVAAVVGWAAIETILWLLSFITIGFAG